MSEYETASGPRMRHRRPMVGTQPITIPTPQTGSRTPGHNPAQFHSKYPLRAALSKRQADVLELIRVKPRNLREASEALRISEWSVVAQVCHQLVNRGLVEVVVDAKVRPTWSAV